MFSFERLEVELDFAHVPFDVSAGIQVFFGSDAFLLVIDAHEHDGDFRSLCDVVEAPFPVRIGRAGAFGRDGEVEFLAFLCLPDNLVDQRCMLVAPHGDASHPPEQDAQGEEEPFFLHHEARLAPDGGDEELSYEKVPVGGMRRGAEHAFVEIRNRDMRFPA